MQLFSSLYARTRRGARPRHAPWYMTGLSFTESSFFFIPPDVMLAPVALAQPRRALHFAALTTLASVAGGVTVYLVGLLAFEMMEPLIHKMGYWDGYLAARDWLDRWGFWAIFIAAFTPIILQNVYHRGGGDLGGAASGYCGGLTARPESTLFLIASLITWCGESMERLLHKYFDRSSWTLWGSR